MRPAKLIPSCKNSCKGITHSVHSVDYQVLILVSGAATSHNTLVSDSVLFPSFNISARARLLAEPLSDVFPVLRHPVLGQHRLCCDNERTAKSVTTAVIVKRAGIAQFL
jgi:hypothetical protein